MSKPVALTAQRLRRFADLFFCGGWVDGRRPSTQPPQNRTHEPRAASSHGKGGVFIHIYPIAPAPIIFLALGAVLLGSRLLPRIFGYLALALGTAFEVVGLVSLFIAPVLTLVVLGLQSLWIVAAAIMLVLGAGKASSGAVSS